VLVCFPKCEMCGTRTELLNYMRSATSRYAEDAKALVVAVKYSPSDEYQGFSALLEAQKAVVSRARDAYLDHCREHGCLTKE
jgi:hypothetical protein